MDPSIFVFQSAARSMIPAFLLPGHCLILSETLISELERPESLMAVEVVRFLVRKFVDSLAEEEEAAAELPFRVHFYDVKAELEKAAISSTNDDELRQCLYELNDLLANRTNMRSGCFSPSEAWRSNSLKKRMIAVKRRVLRSVESDSSGVGGNAAALEEEDSAATGFSRGHRPGFDQQLVELESVAECGAGGLTGVGIIQKAQDGPTAGQADDGLQLDGGPTTGSGLTQLELVQPVPAQPFGAQEPAPADGAMEALTDQVTYLGIQRAASDDGDDGDGGGLAPLFRPLAKPILVTIPASRLANEKKKKVLLPERRSKRQAARASSHAGHRSGSSSRWRTSSRVSRLMTQRSRPTSSPSTSRWHRTSWLLSGGSFASTRLA
uniref:Uncharacterized protein n=1 Tax=Oryza meridionalis TaxID=40149 RepID=A0A0E0F0V5_9ORYZ